MPLAITAGHAEQPPSAAAERRHVARHLAEVLASRRAIADDEWRTGTAARLRRAILYLAQI